MICICLPRFVDIMNHDGPPPFEQQNALLYLNRLALKEREMTAASSSHWPLFLSSKSF